MAKNKPKINNEVNHPKYRVSHYADEITVHLGVGCRFTLHVYPDHDYMYVYTVYKNNKYDGSYKVPDYTHICTAEEMFQNSLLFDVPMQFETIVQLQKALKHQFYQYLYPSKRELCNLKVKYIIDTSYALEDLEALDELEKLEEQ